MMRTQEQIANDVTLLRRLAERFIFNIPLLQLCMRVINDEWFQQCPGGSRHHHAYTGGLLEHVAQVTQQCVRMANAEFVDMEALTGAAILHDYMKTQEYGTPNEQGVVPQKLYRVLVGHLAGTALWFYEQAEMMNMDTELRDRVLHCILSHHGRREWGAAVEPATQEAYILHAADMLCSRQLNGQ
jgi:3'-5' exoribonuclease